MKTEENKNEISKKCKNCKYYGNKLLRKEINIKRYIKIHGEEDIDLIKAMREQMENYGYCKKIYDGIDFDGIEMNDNILVNKEFGCCYYK